MNRRGFPFVPGDLVRNAQGEIRKALTRSVLSTGQPFVFMVDAMLPGEVHVDGHRVWSWTEVDRWVPMTEAQIAMDARVRRLLPQVRAARVRAGTGVVVRQQIGRVIAGR